MPVYQEAARSDDRVVTWKVAETETYDKKVDSAKARIKEEISDIPCNASVKFNIGA